MSQAADRTSIIQMVERLIAFDTTSYKSNLEFIDFIENYLAGFGIKSRLSFDASRQKANLFATLGPEIEGGIVLSGHSDVVPVTGQNWSSDPFCAVERDGRLYGRGTADMKSFIALCLALVPEFLAKPLQKPLHLAISYDEEVGCLGVRGLLADLLANLPRPRLAIIGEPTELGLVSAHKSLHGFKTRVRGQAGHSSLPETGANAIVAAARLIEYLYREAEARRLGMPADPSFDPPYTSFQIGQIEGGTAINVIAEECSFIWEFRALPGEDSQAILDNFERFAREEVLPSLHRTAAAASIETERLCHVPSLRSEEDGLAERLVRRLSGLNDSQAVAYGTEGGHFQQAGLSTVIYGPGSIAVAHQADEFIPIDQLLAYANFLRKLRDVAAGEITIEGL